MQKEGTFRTDIVLIFPYSIFFLYSSHLPGSNHFTHVHIHEFGHTTARDKSVNWGGKFIEMRAPGNRAMIFRNSFESLNSCSFELVLENQAAPL